MDGFGLSEGRALCELRNTAFTDEESNPNQSVRSACSKLDSPSVRTNPWKSWGFVASGLGDATCARPLHGANGLRRGQKKIASKRLCLVLLDLPLRGGREALDQPCALQPILWPHRLITGTARVTMSRAWPWNANDACSSNARLGLTHVCDHRSSTAASGTVGRRFDAVCPVRDTCATSANTTV